MSCNASKHPPMRGLIKRSGAACEQNILKPSMSKTSEHPVALGGGVRLYL